MPAILIQCPPGEIFFKPMLMCPWNCTAKGLQSQKLAISFCSSERCLTVSQTSFASVMKEEEAAPLKETGGAALNCPAESRKKVLIVCQCGSTAAINSGGVGHQLLSVFTGVNLGSTLNLKYPSLLQY